MRRPVEAGSDRVLTSGEVAALLRVAPETVTRWKREGKLRSVAPPGAYPRYREDEVRALAETRGICQARVGLHLGGLVPLGDSLAHSTGCAEPATVTLRAACAHGHPRQQRFCAFHGQVDPEDAEWFCLECAELGHECPLTPEVVAEDAP